MTVKLQVYGWDELGSGDILFENAGLLYVLSKWNLKKSALEFWIRFNLLWIGFDSERHRHRHRH